MKNKPYTNHRFSLLSFPAFAAAALFFLVNQPTTAQAYTTNVTIHEYLGFRGHCPGGNRIYGVNVQHGTDSYYVELLTPMPCLVKHRGETARVTLNRSNNRWTGVYFDGHSARIHKVSKLQNDHSSPYYHDTPTHTHKKDPKFKIPFFTWF